MKYKRLTERTCLGTLCYDAENISILLNRLAEFEDDIESGKIIRLSCKIGDTVWVITECYNSIKGKNNYFINKRKVEAIEFNERCFLLLCNDGGHYILGRRTFLTREEAEAKLKELQE